MRHFLAICAFFPLFRGGEAAAQATAPDAAQAPAAAGQASQPMPLTPPQPAPAAPDADLGSPLQARARALIAASGAGEFFEPADSQTLVSVRHRPSGLVCALDPNARLRLLIYPPSPAVAARGDDVSCGSLSPAGALTIFATRYAANVTLDEAFARAVAEFNAVHPSAQPYTPQVQIDMSDRPSLPETRTAAYLVRGPGGMNYTGIWVARVNGWIVKMRFTGPQGMQSELSSGVSWTGALTTIVRAGRR